MTTLSDFAVGKFVTGAGEDVGQVIAVFQSGDEDYLAIRKTGGLEIDVLDFDDIKRSYFFFDTQSDAETWLTAMDGEVATDEAA